MQEKDVNDMSLREFFEEIKTQERDDYEDELKNLLLSYFALKYSKLLEKYSKPEELENIPSDETAYIKGRFMNIIHNDVDSTLRYIDTILIDSENALKNLEIKKKQKELCERCVLYASKEI